MLKSNLSTVDRIIRIILAAVLAALYFGGVITGTAGLILFIAGAVVLLTAIINFCPIYAALGISSRSAKKP